MSLRAATLALFGPAMIALFGPAMLALFGPAMLAACGSEGASTTSGAIDAAVDASAIVDAPDIDAALVDAAVADACIPSPHAGHAVYACNGFSFDVEVPTSCIGGGCGLIFDVPGRTMNAAMEDANTQLRARGGAAGYIVIQPSANSAPPQSTFSPTPAEDAKLYDFLTRAHSRRSTRCSRRGDSRRRA